MATRKLPMAPWEKNQPQRSETPEEKPMLLCHMGNGELKGLDNLQGGPSFDPIFNLREYSALNDIIKIPEINDLFYAIGGELKEKGKLPHDLHKFVSQVIKYEMPFRESPTEKTNSAIRRIEKMGRKKDSKLAWLPYDLVKLLIDISGSASKNPKSRLLEFGWGDELLRACGTFGGFLLGGPIGAGLGRAATGMVTGQKFGDAAMSGVKAGVLSPTTFALGAVAKKAMPQLAPAIDTLGGLYAGHQALQGLAGGIPALSGILGGGATEAGKVAGEVGKVAGAAGAAKKVAEVAAPSLMGELSGILSNPSLLIGGMGALSAMGTQKKFKEDKQNYEDQQRQHKKYMRDIGHSRDFVPLESKKRVVNPAFHNNDRTLSKYGAYTAAPYLEQAPGYAKGGQVQSDGKGEHVQSYTKGVLLKGPGKGQDDRIKTKVPEGSYIIDASSTGMFGDGSSDAGGNILKAFEEKIRRSVPKNKYVEIESTVISKSPQLPVWLSNDEYKFDPVTVSILGGGSNAKGSKLLKQMVKNIRLHKNGNGDRLPPKAKNPEFYINKGR